MARSETETSRGLPRAQLPGMAPGIVEKVLQGYFSGTRDSLRTYELLELELRAQDGNYAAVALDVSRSGVLLRIVDPAFATPEETSSLMLYTARVRSRLDSGFELAFQDGTLAVRADVIRVTGYCGAGSSLVLIGCRFREALTPDQCRQVGIEHADDRPPG